MVWEIISVHANALVGGLNIRSFEGGLSDDECVDDYTDGPNVYLIGMTLLAFKHFWCNVIGCSANGSLALTIELKFGSQTEVTNLYFHFVVQEQVSELEVSVDNAMSVQVLHGRTDLSDVTLNFKLMETLASAKEFVETLILTQLKQDVNILGVLEEVLESDDVVVVQAAVDFNLRHQFLLGSALG